MKQSTAPERLIAMLLPGLAVWVLLMVAWIVYAPGLKGNFLFDDWVNLPPLGALGPIDTWHALVTYLLSGIAGPTGRPVAMLSFLLDANNWPAPPEPFKYTNILIELLNGALLYWLTSKLACLFKISRGRAAWVAFLSAGLWLLHPLMVSTTLFVVQRMAMLAATFTFVGLLCYLHGRRKLIGHHALAGYLWMTVGVGLCGLLATLSKENGALLPLFVLVIERFVLQQPWSSLRIEQSSVGWRIWRGLFIHFPLALLAIYVLAQIPAMLYGYADVRNFTLAERLLTEARIVVHYLYVILVPRAYTAGLFNDNITLSTDLIHPWTTLPAIGLIAVLLTVGWRMRHRYPALGLAIFFYFGGQLLESTIIPLELYFEHRNYLPAALVFFPLAMWIVTGKKLPDGGRVVIGVALLAMVASLTWLRATLWGHPFQQAIVWAHENPASPRAQTTLSLYLMRNGNDRNAAELLRPVARSHPDNVMVQLNLVSALCGQGKVSPVQLRAANHALATAKVGGRVAYNAIGKFIHNYKNHTCRGLSPAALDSLIQAALTNPHVLNDAGWRQHMLALRGKLRLAQGRSLAALAQFKRSLAVQPRPSAALYEAALLGSAQHPEAGLALLTYYESLPHSMPAGFNLAHLRALWLHHLNYYQREIARATTNLRETAQRAAHKRDMNTSRLAHATGN